MTNLQKVFGASKRAAAAQHCQIFLFGDYIKHEVTNEDQHLRFNVIDFIIAGKFDVDKFYKNLSSEIVINQQIENSTSKYYICSENYIIQYQIADHFDPNNYDDVIQFARFSSDAIFKNLLTDEVIDFTKHGIEHLRSKVKKIKSIVPSDQWTVSDIIGFAIGLGQYAESTIDIDDLAHLQKVKISEAKEPLNITFKDLLLDLLLTFQPGNAIRLFSSIPDGQLWFFSRIVDLMMDLNIPLSDTIKIQDIYSSKKLELLNVYNEFFLFERKRFEKPRERTSRLHTTLRLLFDSPTLTLPTPYIDRVSVLSATLEPQEEKDADFEALTYCPYPPCPPCVPEDCRPHQCCCCSSVDIVSETQSRCFKQTVLSCNEDATGFGLLPEEVFPPECDTCVTACETVLGLRPGFDYCQNWESTGWSEGWWTIPNSHWPCPCHCAQAKSGAPGDCALTCVTCLDWYCGADASVTGHDCNYNITLNPSGDCCGSPAIIDWMFCIDYSTSMDTKINQVVDQCQTLADRLSAKGANVRFALTVFGTSIDGVSSNEPTLLIPFTDDVEDFKSRMPRSTQCGCTEWDIETTCFAATTAEWRGHANFMMLLGDEDSQFRSKSGECDASQNCWLDRAKTILDFYHITWFGVGITPQRTELANHTGGSMFDFNQPFEDVVDSLHVSVFPTSCDCMDLTPIPIRQAIPECVCCPEGQFPPCIDDPWNHECIQNLPERCFDIPINICYPGEQCDCTLPITLNACGHTIVIQPTDPNMECCDQLGLGCNCEPPCDSAPCCGPECYNLCEEFKDFPIGTEGGRRLVADIIWCDCWDKKVDVDRDTTPNCSDCCCPDGAELGDPNLPCSRLNPNDPLCQGENWAQCQQMLADGNCCACLPENQQDCCNCCLKFVDGQCGTTLRHCFPDIRQRTDTALRACGSGPIIPPTWEPPNLKCLKDKCIVGEPDLTGSRTLDEQCDRIYKGCTSVRHPSTVILNNGIGLVAYESITDVSVIRVQQFKTSVNNKLMPNREFNFGRLQHWSKWTPIPNTSYSAAKLYVYEDLPVQLLSGANVDPNDPNNWKDAIAFKTGPLEKQFLPLSVPPYGDDDVGRYLLFYTSGQLSSAFPSSDDVYNVKFFVFNFEDTQFIGDAEDTTTEGKNYIFGSRKEVDEPLLLSPHIYNGEKVPVAYPSIATAANYDDPLENAHFVYLTYQALEDGKWNIYLRQIRLSEYSRQKQIDEALNQSALTPLGEVGIASVILRIFCTTDECTLTGEQEYIVKRTATFEVIAPDGREVFNNPDLSGTWPSLCAGYGSGEFDKSKVFGTLVHTVVADRCPDQATLDQIFNDWDVGQEFASPAESLTALPLLSVLTLPDSEAVSIGSYDPPIQVADVNISSCSAAATWYKDSQETTWSVMSDPAYDVLQKFKGMDISEPIPITNDEVGHCTHPVVKVNYNNDVFIVYESAETGVHQIKITGTNIPSSSLPAGVFVPKNLDANLDYFLHPDSFVYRQTLTANGINQLPDMFIDFNDVVHITWQSNRDGRWEIYYANSENDFYQKRITNYPGKSFKPRIDGDNSGRIYITWHDDRYGNYEIMLAYYEGSRILPLAQQDPYLASMRQHRLYHHYLDEMPLLITNDSDSTLCYNRIVVDFYTDRTLENFAFTLDQNEYPFCFDVPNAQDDFTYQLFDEFSSWIDVGDPYDPYLGDDYIMSEEYDSELAGSGVDFITIDYSTINPATQVEISFKASDIQYDSTSLWTDWASVPTGTTMYEALNLEAISGRYKTVRLRITDEITLTSLIVASGLEHRICLTPQSSAVVTMYLNPPIRLDALGNEIVEFPLPIGFARNNTYFVDVRMEDGSGFIHRMPAQYASVSCSSCSTPASTWNLESCSIKIQLTNDSSFERGFNALVEFYYDADRQRKIVEFRATQNSPDLRYFTIEENQSAEAEWTSNGYLLGPRSGTTLILWPSLSPTAGLICGIKYYVDISTCSSPISENNSCTEMEVVDSIEWVCNCQSLRWSPQFEDAPVSLRDTVRWSSSGDGFADTRLTETKASNLNPIIKIRSNLNGIVLYETNRIEAGETFDANRFRIYASVFSIVPAYNAYTSAGQAISSPFHSVVYRSDIPICPNEADYICGESPCNTCMDSRGVKTKPTILGRNLSFALDQYDSIFMACETAYQQTECNEFAENRQSYITIHTCGADAVDLFRNITEETIETGCNPLEILGRSFTGSENQLLAEIVREIRVKNDYVQYHITSNQTTMPVVSSCQIGFVIIGAPDMVAVRLRNGGGEWSDWYASEPEIGENTIEIDDWQLSNGSGLKFVEFQGATNAGIVQNGSLSIVADYAKITHDIIFYRPTQDTPFPPDGVNLDDTNIWKTENQLPSLSGIPVAALRPPFIEGEGDDSQMKTPTSDYVFIEIIPDQKYMESLEGLPDYERNAIFDFIQQGGEDLLSQPTIWADKEGVKVFRGVVTVSKDNRSTSRDGLAYVIPHFRYDCSDSSSSGTQEASFARDDLNIMLSGQATTTDALAFERDDLGLIKYRVAIRGSDDPYLIFGDPNYRLKT